MSICQLTVFEMNRLLPGSRITLQREMKRSLDWALNCQSLQF